MELKPAYPLIAAGVFGVEVILIVLGLTTGVDWIQTVASYGMLGVATGLLVLVSALVVSAARFERERHH